MSILSLKKEFDQVEANYWGAREKLIATPKDSEASNSSVQSLRHYLERQGEILRNIADRMHRGDELGGDYSTRLQKIEIDQMKMHQHEREYQEKNAKFFVLADSVQRQLEIGVACDDDIEKLKELAEKVGEAVKKIEGFFPINYLAKEREMRGILSEIDEKNKRNELHQMENRLNRCNRHFNNLCKELPILRAQKAWEVLLNRYTTLQELSDEIAQLSEKLTLINGNNYQGRLEEIQTILSKCDSKALLETFPQEEEPSNSFTAFLKQEDLFMATMGFLSSRELSNQAVTTKEFNAAEIERRRLHCIELIEEFALFSKVLEANSYINKQDENLMLIEALAASGHYRLIYDMRRFLDEGGAYPQKQVDELGAMFNRFFMRSARLSSLETLSFIKIGEALKLEHLPWLRKYINKGVGITHFVKRYMESPQFANNLSIENIKLIAVALKENIDFYKNEYERTQDSNAPQLAKFNIELLGDFFKKAYLLIKEKINFHKNEYERTKNPIELQLIKDNNEILMTLIENMHLGEQFQEEAIDGFWEILVNEVMPSSIDQWSTFSIEIFINWPAEVLSHPRLQLFVRGIIEQLLSVGDERSEQYHAFADRLMAKIAPTSSF